MKSRSRGQANVGVGLAGTVAVHVLAGVLLIAGAADAHRTAPPTYRVHLVAAPEPTEEEHVQPHKADAQ